MDSDPTAQFLWRGKTATVERYLTFNESDMSISLCVSVSEVSMCRSMEAAETTPGDICADMELGAHIAHVRTLRHFDRAQRTTTVAQHCTGSSSLKNLPVGHSKATGAISTMISGPCAGAQRSDESPRIP